MIETDSCCERLNETTTEPEVFRNMTEFQLPAEYSTFHHSVRMQFPKFSRGFSCSDFKTFIHEQVGEEYVVALGRLAFPNEWQLQVNNKDVREKLIRMQKTKINMRTCWISPLSQSEVRGHIHWLPTEIPEEKILKELKKYGEVHFIEKQDQDKFKTKVSSDMIYFAMFLRSGKTIDEIPHFITIENHRGFLSIRGRAPICFHCNVVGHRKSECKTFHAKLGEYCTRRPGRFKRKRPRGRRFRTEAQIEAQRLAEHSVAAAAVQTVPDDKLQDLVQAMELGDSKPEEDVGCGAGSPPESGIVGELLSLPTDSVPNSDAPLQKVDEDMVDSSTNTEKLNEKIEVSARYRSGETKAKKKRKRQKKKMV